MKTYGNFAFLHHIATITWLQTIFTACILHQLQALGCLQHESCACVLECLQQAFHHVIVIGKGGCVLGAARVEHH